MQAYKTEAVIDEANRVILSNLPFKAGQRVEVVMIEAPDENKEITEREWLAEAGASDAFHFLSDPAEDIYSKDDGKPLS